jgi:hypothetical protein
MKGMISLKQHALVFAKHGDHCNSSLVDGFETRKDHDQDNKNPPVTYYKIHERCFAQSTINFAIYKTGILQ